MQDIMITVTVQACWVTCRQILYMGRALMMELLNELGLGTSYFL